MYQKDDDSFFIVDAHVALWDARPENLRNIHGKQFIDCFYDYHRNLSPESELWSYEEYLGIPVPGRPAADERSVRRRLRRPRRLPAGQPLRVLQPWLRPDRRGPPRRPVDLPLLRGLPGTGHPKHPRSQGPDHPAAGPGRLRRRRRRPRGHRLHRPQLRCRALRPAAAGGLLLDRPRPALSCSDPHAGHAAVEADHLAGDPSALR